MFALLKLRAALLFVLLAGLLLAGCGGATTPAPTQESQAEAGQPTAQPTPGDQEQEPASEAQPDQSGATRAVKHAMGETQVPANPQRVVVLDTGELDSALALGVKPVGAVSAFADGQFPAYLADQTEGIQNVGTIQQPNLEAILALKPDLILSSKLRHEEIYEQLSKIAPTVFTESVGVTWKENFKLHAEALGKSAEAEQLMQSYNARMDEFKQKMGDRLSQTQVSIVRFLPNQIRMYMKASFIGTIIEDAGLPRTPAQDKDKFMEEGSKERIPDMDGDVMFVTTYGPAEETALAEYKNDPLWQQLRVVQNNKVYEVDDSYWMLGIGIQAATLVQNDLFELFLGEDSRTSQ